MKGNETFKEFLEHFLRLQNNSTLRNLNGNPLLKKYYRCMAFRRPREWLLTTFSRRCAYITSTRESLNVGVRETEKVFCKSLQSQK